MPTDKRVVVYGASGYTGRLICEYLREYNIPFLAAGRGEARVKGIVDAVPGVETVEYDVVEVFQNLQSNQQIIILKCVILYCKTCDCLARVAVHLTGPLRKK